MASNPDVYPTTAAFEKFAAEQHGNLKAKTYTVGKLGEVMGEVIGEYEHGIAEPEDVFRQILGFDLSAVDDDRERRRICLDLYAAVCRDLLLSFLSWANDVPPNHGPGYCEECSKSESRPVYHQEVR